MKSKPQIRIFILLLVVSLNVYAARMSDGGVLYAPASLFKSVNNTSLALEIQRKIKQKNFLIQLVEKNSLEEIKLDKKMVRQYFVIENFSIFNSEIEREFLRRNPSCQFQDVNPTFQQADLYKIIYSELAKFKSDNTRFIFLSEQFDKSDIIFGKCHVKIPYYENRNMFSGSFKDGY